MNFGRTRGLLKRCYSRSLSLSASDVVILSAARTPIGSLNGSLSSLTAVELGVASSKAAIERSGVSPEQFDECFMGNVCSANAGQAPARQVAVHSGLGYSVPCTTLNKVCASSLKAVIAGAQSLKAGDNSVVLAGGFESMTHVPYYVPKGRTGYGYGHGELLDGVLKDGLWDSFDNRHMGMCGEDCAATFGFSREDQDSYAVESYRRAARALENGFFEEEIVPVEVKSRRGVTVVKQDEEILKVNFDKVPKLRPAFRKDGTITAANAPSLNDASAAVVIATGKFAMENGLEPLARIGAYGDAARKPAEFTIAPRDAFDVAFSRSAGMTATDVDFWEINEAFSVVALANMRLLGISHDKVNVNGGAVALGHPIGCSGVRILATLLSVLKQRDASVGAVGICNGGGGATALIVERL